MIKNIPELSAPDPAGYTEGFHIEWEAGLPVVRHGKFRVAWVNLGEGWEGDYDPDDPSDENLLRFDVFIKEESHWVDPGDASYCTQVPASTSVELLILGACYILEEVRGAGSLKRSCERLSWISPELLAAIAKD